MGVKRGVSDWQYLCDNGQSKWIELKTDDGVQSIDQERFERLVTSLGHEYIICRDEQSFWSAIGWTPPHFKPIEKV